MARARGHFASGAGAVTARVHPDPLGAELQATFISAPTDVASATRASFIAYRKTFPLVAAPRTASLHVFADARYLLWINGRPVHRCPNRFEIREPQYDTVEIADTLHAGANTLAIVAMGNGCSKAPSIYAATRTTVSLLTDAMHSRGTSSSFRRCNAGPLSYQGNQTKPPRLLFG